MFYIRTADKLQRTARWIEQLPGGLAYLKEVVLEDRLGICASLEAQMQELVDSFFDEWAEAVADPAIAAKFRQFANTDEALEGVETERDRDQSRPVYWPRDPAAEDFAGLRGRWSSTSWQPVIEASHFAGADDTPNGVSAAIKRGDTQLALWRVKGRYYATQQMCPHKRAFALSDGLIGQDLRSSSCSGAASPNDARNGEKGETQGEVTEAAAKAAAAPWISCPFHKRNFDLSSGACRNDDALSVATFDAEERADGLVYLRLPPVEELDAALGTSKWKVKKGDAEGEGPFAELDKKIGFKGRRAKKPGVRPVGDLPMRRPVEVMAGGGCGAAPEW
ncbi:hypothetical protein DL762_008329 [Monosporascus cannonballus]|uniref:Rieske domain-containing protein n=1 Tax=Monosporascus cannonballus TaxID=155416 RepID=A0ABY0H109_9PEZI|nr:hypothetical protein DL762_008329 [Monosporascus cannonballus]